LPAAFLLELCQSVPVDIPKDLKTSLKQKQLIYLERFAQKLQRNLDRQVIGF